MERTGALIERLTQQYKENAGTDVLLATVQLLAAELQQGTKAPAQAGKKISVIMPAFVNREEAAEEKAPPPPPKPAPVQEIKPVEEVKPAPPKPAPVEAVKPAPPPPVAPPVSQPKIQFLFEEKPNPAPPAEPPKTKQVWQYDPIKDIPTLAHQQNEKLDLNELIGAKQEGESFNDRLKTGNVELGATLQSAPVRDLKKAIGINDRYVFVNELFRGDEVMYERSIKTINGFSILAEAEFWIKRELKLKLAWNESADTVKQFDQLVRRRFS